MTTFPDLTHPLDDLQPEARERFTIQDDGAAAWAMRKLRAIRSKQAENSRIAQDEIDRVQMWLKEVNAPLDRDASYFEGILRDYAIRCRESMDDGRKSLNLPTGKVATRVGSDKFEIDATAFLPWAKQNAPQLIRVKEEPNLSALKEFAVPPSDAPSATSDGVAITSDGEVIPGVRVTPGELSVTVTPDLN